MRSRKWPRCRGRNCARSAPGLSRTSRRRSCATYCWRILQSARTPGPANPSPVEGPFGSAGARGELPPDHCGEEILDSSDKRGVDALVRHAGHDIELHCDAVASEAVVKTLDPFDARSAAVVGSRHPLWRILGHGDFPGLRVVGSDDHLNGNPARVGEIDEPLSIALRAASAAVDGDHQGMLGILFLAARRHIKAIGEALVEAAREHGRLAALVERKRAGSSGAWSHDYFSGGRVYASRNRSRQPNQAPGSS